MAIKAFRGVESSWYIPELEEGTEDPAQFKIRPLTASEQIQCVSSYQGNTVSLETFMFCFSVACEQIKGVTNHANRSVTTAAEFLLLPDMWKYINQVGAEIYNRSFLSEEDIKNL